MNIPGITNERTVSYRSPSFSPHAKISNPTRRPAHRATVRRATAALRVAAAVATIRRATIRR
jgi:hypothetical protein